MANNVDSLRSRWKDGPKNKSVMLVVVKRKTGYLNMNETCVSENNYLYLSKSDLVYT